MKELNAILKEITLAGETVRKYQEYLETVEEKLEGIAETELVKEINYQIDHQINNGNFVSSGESFYNFCLEDVLENPNFKKEVWEDLENLLRVICDEKNINLSDDDLDTKISEVWEELIFNAENNAYEQCLIRGSYSIKR